jgi:hypothetical protein
VQTPLVNEMIQQGNVSMYDLSTDLLEDGVYKMRQLVQIKHTSENTEWISDELTEILTRFKYPLHFIDFETSRLAIAPNQQDATVRARCFSMELSHHPQP